MSTPEKRPVSFFSLFNRGQHYAKTWPLDKRLAPVFIENRIISCHPLCYPYHAADRHFYAVLADRPWAASWVPLSPPRCLP